MKNGVRAGQVDAREHRVHEGAVPGDGLGDRLVARVRDLRPRVLQVEPVALPARCSRRASRTCKTRRRQLGSRRPDGARQRAGGRRQGLALGRAGREARDPDVLPQDHRLRRGAARVPRQDARLARAREDDAGQLDRQERRRALRVPARHPGRRRASSSATAACTCSRRAPTRSWASRSAPSRPSIRWPQRRPRTRPEARRVRRRVQARLGDRGRPRDDGKEGHAHRPFRPPSDHRTSRSRCGSATTCSWRTATAR